MKTLILLLIINVMYFQNAISQSSILERVPLSVFLDRVSEEFNVTFSYSKDFLPLNHQITVSNKFADLKSTLDNAFANEPISYMWIGESVVLKVKPKVQSNRPDPKSISKPRPSTYTASVKRSPPVTLSHYSSIKEYQLVESNASYPHLYFDAKPKKTAAPISRPVFDKKTNSITAFNPLDYRMPRMIVLEAFERIEDNFFVKPQIFKGYFREIFKEDQRTVSLVDAIVKITDRGYKQVKQDQKGLETVNLLAVRSSDNMIRPEFKPDFDKFNSLRRCC